MGTEIKWHSYLVVWGHAQWKVSENEVNREQS